jgi:hypothetical protein
MNKPFEKVLLIVGIIGILVVMWLLFAPMNDITQKLNTTFVSPVTDNLTAIATENSTISAYNEFQGGLLDSLWFIVVGGIVLCAIVVLLNNNDGGQ